MMRSPSSERRFLAFDPKNLSEDVGAGPRSLMRFTLILFEEHPASKKLKRDGVTALHVWGSLFFSGAYTLQERLDKTRAFETIPRQDLFPATEAVGESNLRAIRAAETWPAERNHGLT